MCNEYIMSIYKIDKIVIDKKVLLSLCLIYDKPTRDYILFIIIPYMVY